MASFITVLLLLFGCGFVEVEQKCSMFNSICYLQKYVDGPVIILLKSVEPT